MVLLERFTVKRWQKSRINITTHSKKVAKFTGSMKPYELRVLDDDQSWIYKKMAFERGQEPENSTNCNWKGNCKKMQRELLKP